MWQDAALFIFGFFILIKGAGILIDGASAIARKVRVSEWLIGLTIVGIGTSIPEFAVMLSSALSGKTAMGLGAIIGSNTLGQISLISWGFWA
jgi:cation:H+ antiporter